MRYRAPRARHWSLDALVGVWPPLPPSVYLRRPARARPFPLESSSCRRVAKARHGLWLGARAIGLRPGDEILAPAWHHGSEIEALVRAGVRCRFYEATPSLSPDPQELERLLDRSVRALQLTHYLGFPQDVPNWRRWCDDRGLLLIEDAAQAWLGSMSGRPLGSWGHLSVFCFYKTYGLPDGGAYVTESSESSDFPAGTQRASAGGRALLHRHAAWAAGRFPLAATASRLRRLPEAHPLDGFALGDPHSAPAPVSGWLLSRLADPQTAARRREHYATLRDALGDRVLAPFRELPDDVSPFALPFVTRKKKEALAEFARHGVAALNFWSVAHPHLCAERFPGAAALRASVVALPVHQELRPCDLKRIARAAAAAP